MITRHYKKRPVEITATRWDGTLENADDIALWVGDKALAYTALDGTPSLIIYTLEGDMRAKEGDWIIRGVAGEFYPCDHAIFQATYDIV